MISSRACPTVVGETVPETTGYIPRSRPASLQPHNIAICQRVNGATIVFQATQSVPKSARYIPSGVQKPRCRGDRGLVRL